MAHVAKYTRGAMGHLLSHYDRSKDISGEIDKEKTVENYNLGPKRDISQTDFIRQRTEEVQCLNRKDVNVMCSWVVTAPKDFPAEDNRKFFKETYKFLSERYGGEKNVISSYVHMDEKTPHMHFAVVPVVADQRKGIEKVSAKECITRADLQSFHEDLEKHLAKSFGREVGILNDATREGNRSITELKRGQAVEDFNAAAQRALEARESVLRDEMRLDTLKREIAPLRAEYASKRAYVKACDTESQISMEIPEYAKLKKNPITGKETITVPREKWEQKHVSANEKQYLVQAREDLSKELESFSKSVSGENMAQLKESLEYLVKKLNTVNRENSGLADKLQKAEKEAGKVIDRVNNVLGKLPEAAAGQFIKQWETELKHEQGYRQSRGFEHER